MNVHKSSQPPRRPVFPRMQQTPESSTMDIDQSIQLFGNSQRSFNTATTTRNKDKDDMDGSFASILDEPEDQTHMFNNSFSKFLRGVLKEKHVEERLVRQRFAMKHQDSLRLMKVDKSSSPRADRTEKKR